MSSRPVFLVTLLLVAVGPALAESTTRFVVGFHEFPPGVSSGTTWKDAQVVAATSDLGFILADAADATAFAIQASSDPNVEYYGELVIDVHTQFPNDPFYSNQYAPGLISAPSVWSNWHGDTSKSVCIVDTGVRATHEEFTGRFLGGVDYTSLPAVPIATPQDAQDATGHGTRMAGTILAGLNNSIGISGLANVPFYSARVLDKLGGHAPIIALGIKWCADVGADVISMSLGAPPTGALPTWKPLERAVDYAWDAGALLVAAGGNTREGWGPAFGVDYPAALAHVIAVACTDASSNRCPDTKFGPEIDLSAPGTDIYSTSSVEDFTYDYTYGGYTSPSTAQVSGVAALIWTQAPCLTNADIRHALESSASDLGAPEPDWYYGKGLVNANSARLIAVEPAQPTSVIATADPVNYVNPITWSHTGCGGDSSITGFRVYRGATAVSLWPYATTPASSRSFDDYECYHGDVCYYAVSALTATRESLLSAVTSAPGAGDGWIQFNG